MKRINKKSVYKNFDYNEKGELCVENLTELPDYKTHTEQDVEAKELHLAEDMIEENIDSNINEMNAELQKIADGLPSLRRSTT
jgi:hypothetical protein